MEQMILAEGMPGGNASYSTGINVSGNVVTVDKTYTGKKLIFRIILQASRKLMRRKLLKGFRFTAINTQIL